MSKIKLGSTVKDIVSGFTGVAVACHTYLNGCKRISVQPVIDEKGCLPEDRTFDEPQLVVIGKNVISGDNSTGGPEKYTDTRRY